MTYSPPTRRVAERDNTIAHWQEFDHGRHFATMEEPGPFVTDVRGSLRASGSRSR